MVFVSQVSQTHSTSHSIARVVRLMEVRLAHATAAQAKRIHHGRCSNLLRCSAASYMKFNKSWVLEKGDPSKNVGFSDFQLTLSEQIPSQ